VPGSLWAAEEKKIQFPAASQQRGGKTACRVDRCRGGLFAPEQETTAEIFGGLVPYGKLWRTGANAVTKIKFSNAVNARRPGDPGR